MHQQGLISSLFDFSFTSFITPKIQKFLYVLLLIGGVIVGPLVFLLLAMYFRVMMEILIVMFKGVEYQEEIATSVKK